VYSLLLSSCRQYVGSLQSDTIEGYFKRVVTNDGVSPYLKSEPLPTDNDDPLWAVKIVVGTTFQQMVMNGSHEVLLEAYAPWCGHCKSLSPTYEKLGRLFASEKRVLIAKVDATANDLPSKVALRAPSCTFTTFMHFHHDPSCTFMHFHDFHALSS
jgi:thiol-disulfide isomerase/thioredoxin